MKHKIMCSCGKLAIKCDEASKALQFIVNNGKKEVFDDIDKMINNKDRIRKDGSLFYAYLQEDFQKVKKRHLSTFPEKKKGYNSSFIQDCTKSFDDIITELKCCCMCSYHKEKFKGSPK